ncbi:hypothetical protein [Stackebrandtia nassauensis]|uniref:Uncharacterized protein n=1 Tax=Stackebrandtia nassauensis (strain DSM 44728 / CIP 108903 / NRRL B-16338 / NBRC 102104 / LLR-40K-21) TaxID=446470 RepID=D3PY96_STANL|nr:hypothetical protein [Stackebrandtia nassauensis]ADD41463.1 hypothetical protein Snas_1766 [Stackebrandtia nassauensis DSM 44728]
MPDPVAAELYDLWKAGAVSLPMVAEVYATAAGGTHATGEGDKDEQAFDRTSNAGVFDPAEQMKDTMFPLGTVYPIWTELRDTLNTVLAKSATNLYDTGEALVTVSENFAEKDAGAAADLDELRKKHLDSQELDQPPGRRLEPPMPDDSKTPGQIDGDKPDDSDVARPFR